jgi:hypothetical protein
MNYFKSLFLLILYSNIFFHYKKEIFKKIEKLFRTKFHTVNKNFSSLDINHTEKIDKNSFKTLLEK